MPYPGIMGRVPCGGTVYEVKWEIPADSAGNECDRIGQCVQVGQGERAASRGGVM
jgi:hypothetical protein